MPEEIPAVVRVTLEDIYGAVLATQKEVVTVTGKLNELSQDSHDHEQRIRRLEDGGKLNERLTKLEEGYWRLVGKASGAGAVIGAVAAMVLRPILGG